jgi:hypothetical protein
VAKVDSTGALKTTGTANVSGYVGETIPKTPFVGHEPIDPGVSNTLIAANKATVALTRLELMNYYDQTNSAAVDIRLLQESGNTTTCDGSTGSVFVGSYDVWAGQTVSDAVGSPIVLKPLVSGDVWCLTAVASVQGGPSGFYWPEASFSGYVAAGTLPAGAVSTASVAGNGPRHTTR